MGQSPGGAPRCALCELVIQCSQGLVTKALLLLSASSFQTSRNQPSPLILDIILNYFFVGSWTFPLPDTQKEKEYVKYK